MKMVFNKALFVLGCFFFVFCLTFSQNSDGKRNAKLFKRALHLADEGNYKDAISSLKVILHSDPKDLDALFNIGLCYLNTSDGADTALIYFNKGMDVLTDEQKTGYFGREFGMSIGKAYQVLLKPLKAVEIYEDLLVHLGDEDTLVQKELEREIQVCHNANFFLEHPIDIVVENMGSEVNSMYDDHSPLVGVSENQLFFTSRRNWIKLSLLPDGQYAEKIYSVPLSAKNWESARLLKVFFRQNEHEAAASLSPDGDDIVLFRNDEHGKSLYISHFDGDNWSEPEKLPFPINSFAQETHGSLSADKSTLFFTSDREGGFGGIDIYMSKKNAKGVWGNPINLGANINTEYDEETPMIHYDGKTLYFSSEGHNSMGRLDVFYAQMNADSTWGRPVNLGYPINTPDDDFFFVPTVNKSHAYYASSKFDDNYGGSDIYHVKFETDDNTELAVVEGRIDETLGTNMNDMRILVTRRKDKRLVGDYRPNPTNGNYMLFLEVGYEYEIKETNSQQEKEKVSYVNATPDMSYLDKRTPVVFTDVAMDAPLTKADVEVVTDLGQDAIEHEVKGVVEGEIVVINEPSVEGVAEDKGVGAEPRPEREDAGVSQVEIVTETENNTSTVSNAVVKPKTVVPVMIVERDDNFVISTRPGYTIQILALEKGPLKDMSFFTRRGVNGVVEVKCVDGFTRYILGEFNGYRESLKIKKKLVADGYFKDIWIRPLRDLDNLKLK